MLKKEKTVKNSNQRLHILRILFITLCIPAVLSLNSCSLHKNPIEILKNCEKACSDIQSGKYTVLDASKAVTRDTLKVLKGTIIFKKCKTNGLFSGKFRIDSEDGNVISYDGVNTKWLKPLNRKVLISDTSYNKNMMFILQNDFARMAITPILIESSFDRIIQKSQSVTYEGEMNVANVDCDIIRVQNRVQKMHGVADSYYLWYIGVEDHLPRKIEQRYTLSSGNKNETKYMITEFAKNIEISDSIFDLKTPEGFRTEYSENPSKDEDDENAKLLSENEQAPDFSLKNEKGKEISLSDYKGKTVLIDFWGSWCQPCLEALPDIKELNKKYSGKNVVVLGVSCLEKKDGEPGKAFKKAGCKYELILNGDETAKKYKVFAYPTIYIISPDGKVAFRQAGAEDIVNRASEKIDKLIGNSVQ